MTVAVTVFALLELYKRGEAAWEQDEPFGPITVHARRAGRLPRRPRREPSQRDLEALLFLAPDPVPVAELADALRVEEDEVAAGLRRWRRRCDGRGVVLREVGGGWTLASHPDAEEAARRLLARPRTPDAHAGPGRDAVDRGLPAAGLPPRGGPHPRRGVGVGDERAGRPRR